MQALWVIGWLMVASSSGVPCQLYPGNCFEMFNSTDQVAKNILDHLAETDHRQFYGTEYLLLSYTNSAPVLSPIKVKNKPVKTWIVTWADPSVSWIQNSTSSASYDWFFDAYTIAYSSEAVIEFVRKRVEQNSKEVYRIFNAIEYDSTSNCDVWIKPKK